MLPGCNISFYDLHDGKMLYMLTQHSLWNCTHHPFLLCKCKRGEGAVNSNHQCELLSHDDQLKLWDRSLRRWNEKISRSGSINYSRHTHMDWIDEHNFGISQFGLHPDILPREHIRFDVFHMRCAITRRLMACLRKFMLRTPPELMKKFSDLIRNFWSIHNVLIWNTNRPFTSFVGSELLAFIQNSTVIVDFLKNNFRITPELNDLANGLHVWSKITPFLVIVDIDDIQAYEKNMERFTDNLKVFYDIGKMTFLTKKRHHRVMTKHFICTH